MPSTSTRQNTVADVAAFDALSELALNLRWSWNHAADRLWEQLDAEQWKLTRNPWIVLQTISQEALRQALADPAFHLRLTSLVQEQRGAFETPAWFQCAHAAAPLESVAYFSMEYMLSEALPIYSGGLGNVAGDQLKSASDLGVPITGVGLLYAQGYFRQVINPAGKQEALYPYNDPGQLPILPLRQSTGEWLRLEIALSGYSVWLRAWQVNVGRLKLYLLDSNDLANDPTFRGITAQLYGGGSAIRLQQELALGIGGWRLLTALGLQPDVCHLNEGHAAFAILERARTFMAATGHPFDAALTITRAGNVFTTHTAVPAGFDCFAPGMIEQHLGQYAKTALKISPAELLALGRSNPDDAAEPFNMAYLAAHGSGTVNGVSRLHSEVSRGIFQPLFPRWPRAEVPIGHVTNGVHTPSWDSAEADTMWTDSCGKDRWRYTVELLPGCVRRIPDDAIWNLRLASRRALIDYARERLSRQLAVSGMSGEEIDRARHCFGVETLTLGFARRFATYKRPNLLLQDRDRLLRLLTNTRHPVQLILAGKAHPADTAGQALIEEWIHFIRQPEVRAHAMFLGDYDMLLTARLVQGVDVWINTPQRPWEACGTSGMKVLVNGGLNVSELDGWWAEAYSPRIGWALGDGQDHGGDPLWDARDAAQLFDILEGQVIPEFYSRDASATPRTWVGRVRESMASLTGTYSANRSVRQYVEQCYLPAAAAYQARAANGGELGVRIAVWKRALATGWATVRLGRAAMTAADGAYEFTIEAALGALDPLAVQVELCAESPGAEARGAEAPGAEARGAQAPFRQEMTRTGGPDGAGRCHYRATVPAGRPSGDYTARIRPAFSGVNVPLEAAMVLWER
jgi:starch phosphorylase